MGGWEGGQANYVMVPFADFNLLKFPDRDQALEKILDLTMLSDIFPTGYHGAYTAQVSTGSTFYVAGAGPVGLAAAYSALLLGRGGRHRRRPQRGAAGAGEDLRLRDGQRRRGYAAREQIAASSASRGRLRRGRGRLRGLGQAGRGIPAVVLNQVQSITRAGGSLGIPGLYVTGDPGAADPDAQEGTLKIRFGLGWAKSHAFFTGQCPVKKYNRGLMMSILHDKAQIAKGRQRHGHFPGRGPPGLQGLRQGRGQKVRHQPERLHQRVDAKRSVSKRGRIFRPLFLAGAILRTS
jgi:glutathione-independent formaldehyde dehydrogenase